MIPHPPRARRRTGRRLFIACVATAAWPAGAQLRPVLRISVLSNGVLIADGSLTSLSDLDRTLARLKEAQGIVWYYRETGPGDPPPAALEAIKLVAKHGLPISFSSREDFADEVGADGSTRPRRR